MYIYIYIYICIYMYMHTYSPQPCAAPRATGRACSAGTSRAPGAAPLLFTCVVVY